jgi:tetratricopeptide (TPR) repeat protein
MPKIQKHDRSFPVGTLLLALSLGCSWPAFAGEKATKIAPAKEDTELAQTAMLREGTAGSYLAGRFAQDSGNVDAAISYLSRALSKDPGNMSFASQLLAMQVAKGDMASALKTAEIFKASGTPDALADLLVTVQMIRQKDLEGASRKLSNSFDYANGQLWLPLVDAWVDAGAGRIKQPITIEEMPVTVGRAASVINYHLALINAYAGYKEQAATNFADAAEDPETTPLRIMQQLQAFSEKNPSFTKLKSIVTNYEAVHASPLVPLESPDDSPQDGVAEVLYTMGNVMQMAGVRHDAMVYLQLARYLRPDLHLASFTLAEVLADGKAYERASVVLGSIPATSQYSMKATLRQALITDRLGRSAEALEMLDKLIEQDTNATDPWIARGDLLRVHDRFLEASIAYGEAISRIPEPSPKDWAVFYARGACYERLDRWTEAKADLEKALKLNPNQPDVLNYLGYGLVTRGESINEAKVMLEKALTASPNDPQIIDSMGWALYALGKYKEALPYLERAVELLASDATVNDHLGDAYWRLGRKTEARFQWQRALTYKPEPAEVKKIEGKLASGLPDVEGFNTRSASADPIAAATP